MLKLLLLVTLCTSVIEVNETDNDRGEKGGDKVPEKGFYAFKIFEFVVFYKI